MPLLPLPLVDVTDLLFGRVDYVVSVHVDLLDQRLAERGISAHVARGNASVHKRRARGQRIEAIPATVREQVQFELLTIDLLAASIEWFLDLLVEHGPLRDMSLGYRNEAAVWEAADHEHEGR